jgi:xanthine dehydrogenase FAD-binding subunit
MHRQSFYSPKILQEALGLLADNRGRPLAGGTDIIPHLRDGRFQSPGLIDITRLVELRYIKEEDGTIRIGSLTTFDDIVRAPLLQREAAALVEAARLIGSPQTRNRGTLGGNIGNASPAGDALPPLLVLNAKVHLVSARGTRAINLQDFLLGPGRSAIEAGELIHSVSFESLPWGTTTIFQRLGNRSGMAVSIASTAIALRLDKDKKVKDVRIALGAVAPTAIRCLQAEAVLLGQKLSDDLIRKAARVAGQGCSPIDDVRASAAYRRHVVEQLVRRALTGTNGKDLKGSD